MNLHVPQNMANFLFSKVTEVYQKGPCEFNSYSYYIDAMQC